MGSQQDLVLIDTNVFVIDLRYKGNRHYHDNLVFLGCVAENRTGFTTVVNLLELCGILSFNLNEKQLLELWIYFEDKYKVAVLPTTSMDTDFPAIKLHELFDAIKKRTPLGDALMLIVAQKFLPFISTMITWDKDHFQGKFAGDVLTPEEFLELE